MLVNARRQAALTALLSSMALVAVAVPTLSSPHHTLFKAIQPSTTTSEHTAVDSDLESKPELDASIDAGYESLMEDQLDNVDPEQCYALTAPIPASLAGGYLIVPSVSQFGIGHVQFTGELDGFGRLMRVRFPNTTHGCVLSKMMNTRFYEESLDKNVVAPGLLFSETHPPMNYSAIQNLMAPNDNNFVNSIKVDGDMRMLSDTQTQLSYSPDTLDLQAKIKWTDSLDRGSPISLGSAHPVRYNSSCFIGVDQHEGMLPGMGIHVALYWLCDDSPTSRVLINSFKTDYVPYFHSFGVTENYLILPLQHFEIDFNEVMIKGHTLDKAFKRAGGDDLDIVVLPINGSDPTVFTLPATDLYYVHFANSYEDGELLVFDLPTYTYNVLGVASLAVQRNKTARDFRHPPESGTTTRFTANMRTKTIDQQMVSVRGRVTDFIKTSEATRMHKHCFYWANEWWHDDNSYAAMAIVKQPLCNSQNDITGNIPSEHTLQQRKYWAEPHVFPSEPCFVPDVNGTSEDAGIVLFTATDGVTRTSDLVVADASSLKEIARLHLPIRMTFTTHLEWYSKDEV